MEGNMRITYIILAHRFPKQLARLVSRLDAPSVTFLIHIDANTDDATHSEMVNAMLGRYNLFFLPRHRCSWAGWGIVEATLEGLEQVIRAKLLPDYVILLSGQDYPLRTPADIELFLTEHRGTSFIGFHQLPDYTWNWHGSIDRFRGQSLPSGMKPFGGSQWWALSGDCAAYVKGIADGDRDLIRLFETMWVPDEHVFQTIVLNSPFRDRLSHADTEAVFGLHYMDWWRGAPKVLDVEDFERLIASPALFARKFDMTQDSEILDMIDAHLTRRAGPVEQVVPSVPQTVPGEAMSSPGHFFAALRDERPTKPRWVRDESVAWGTVLYNIHTAHTMTLNATAALIWDYCDGQHDVASIAAELREVFPDAPDTESDLVGVLHKLMFAGMIIDSAVPPMSQDKRGRLIRRALRVVSRQKWVKAPIVRKMSGAARGAFRQRS